MRNTVYVVFCAIGALLCLLPLPWHWQARNVSTLIYLGWVSSACLLAFTNSILWAGNVDDKAPVWCDITSRYTVCHNAGITAAGLCIQRHLYRVATIKEVTSVSYSRKRELAINLVLGVGVPALMIPLYSVVQSSRYTIIEDIGCWPSTYPTLLVEFMVHIWPVLISCASFIYAGLTIRAFLKTRRQFSKVLSESGAGLSLSRFFRLMALAATDMVCALPLSLYFLIADPLTAQYLPWVSWSVTHKYINEVDVVTYEVMQAADQQSKVLIGLNRWTIPGCSFLFFMYFGLSTEAVKQYKRIFWKIAAPFGFKPPVSEPRTQTVSWTKRLVLRTTTTFQSNASDPSVCSVHPVVTPSHEDKEEQKGGDEGGSPLTEVKDLECQVSTKTS
ncbi:STE3-type pheromone receptor [Ceratobasidium sp. AG-Ba]|nr:STE3-type pheromone receptor [Ceratobasidium sp. AG-Ba]